MVILASTASKPFVDLRGSYHASNKNQLMPLALIAMVKHVSVHTSRFIQCIKIQFTQSHSLRNTVWLTQVLNSLIHVSDVCLPCAVQCALKAGKTPWELAAWLVVQTTIARVS